MSSSQSKSILEHLLSGKSISPIEALNLYGSFRLGARIHDLKHGIYDGTCYNIKERNEKNGGKRYARYYLEETKEHPQVFKPAAIWSEKELATRNEEQQRIL
jgi:hypothetical protein